MKFAVVILCLVSFSQAILTHWNKDAGCYLLVGQRLRHREFLVDKKVSVLSLYDCKKECDASFINCLSFSYNTDFDDRYDDNCLLSRSDVSRLQLREGQHLQFDRDYIIYGRVNQEECSKTSAISATSRMGIVGGVNSCFRLAKKGVRMSSKYVKIALKVASRAECEAKCLAAGFVCRGFNYKHTTGFSAHYMDNCELTYQDTYGTDLDDKLAFYGHYDYDFYERISFSSNCGSLSISGSALGREIPWHPIDVRPNFHSQIDDGCFRLYRKSTRLDMRLILERQYASSVAECKEFCRKLRACKSFAFRYASITSRWSGSNCFLSDYRIRHMDSVRDLISDSEYDLYEKDELSSACVVGAQSRTLSVAHYLDGGGSETVSGQKCYRDGCHPDVNGGYYFCYTDHEGAWDYCCRPDDQCHMSSKYPTEWCHVGVVQEDQWRPCLPATKSRAFLKSEPPKAVAMMADPTPNKNSEVTKEIEVKDIKDLVEARA